MCIQHVLEEKDFFNGCPRVSLCYEVLPFIFDYQLNRDNSAVLAVSQQLSLMVNEVDGIQAETGGLERCHARTAKMPCSHCTINRQRCIKPHPCNLTSTNIISFCSHVFSVVKFTHAWMVCTRLTSFLAAPPSVFPVKPRREPVDEASSALLDYNPEQSIEARYATSHTLYVRVTRCRQISRFHKSKSPNHALRF